MRDGRGNLIHSGFELASCLADAPAAAVSAEERSLPKSVVWGLSPSSILVFHTSLLFSPVFCDLAVAGFRTVFNTVSPRWWSGEIDCNGRL